MREMSLEYAKIKADRQTCIKIVYGKHDHLYTLSYWFQTVDIWRMPLEYDKRAFEQQNLRTWLVNAQCHSTLEKNEIATALFCENAFRGIFIYC